jgi:hypothetical protein
MFLAVQWDDTLITLGVVAFGFLVATPYVRGRRKSASIDYGAKALALAQAELQTERDAREAQETRSNERISEMERRHAHQIGEVNGRVTVLTESFAQVIATQVAADVVASIRDDAAKVIAAHVAATLTGHPVEAPFDEH